MSDGISGDGLTLAVSTTAVMLATSVSSNPFEVLPLSAGISASMISVLRGRSLNTPATRMQLALSFLSGVSAVMFIAPMFCKHIASHFWEHMDVETRTFIYLVFGLIGSTLIDLILERRRAVSEKIAVNLFKKWEVNQATNPAPEYHPEVVPDVKNEPTKPS